MNSEIFKAWFQNEFVPTVEKHLKDNLPRKAVLFLDDAPSHPATEELSDGDIKALRTVQYTQKIYKVMACTKRSENIKKSGFWYKKGVFNGRDGVGSEYL